MRLTQRTVDTIHAVTVAGCLVIIGLTIYNWRTSGRVDFGSIGVVVLIFVLVALQRLARRDRSPGAE
ncbi:MAG TPA: hypothetical protein VMS12_09045 [Thermoanaerobaculia bacterium]|nr:hypothetical protein [Thermoanaerobaculia bacterium]